MWVDVETTGLDPTFHQLLEIAVVVTNSSLRPLGSYSSVVHWTELVSMVPKVREMHLLNGLLDEVYMGGKTLTMINADILSMFTELGVNRDSPLAGSSVHFDRRWLVAFLPNVESWVHYRNMDVSTLKEMAMRWLPDHQEWQRSDAHRALSDIHNSINELRYYRSRMGMAARKEEVAT